MEKHPTAPPQVRLIVAILLPIVGAILVKMLAGDTSRLGATRNQSTLVLLLGPLGLISWFLGMRWYGLPGMGLRGKRPLFAGIGFSVLGWTAFLILRMFVASRGLGTGTREFVYLLIFEAFAVQLWVFGLLFRSLADWRGPMTAAISSGIIFGAAAFLFFQESFIPTFAALLYFVIWGILYGIIRLRTGSILGVVVVQALQSFTGWVVLLPSPQPDPAQLQTLYLGAGLCYLVFIWRLWPKQEDDYRV